MMTYYSVLGETRTLFDDEQSYEKRCMPTNNMHISRRPITVEVVFFSLRLFGLFPFLNGGILVVTFYRV